MSVHEGHRKRLKQRFRQEGLDGFDELYVLELLLFYCVPQKDTNLLAHDLLNRFGSLTQVLEAPYQELEKVPGVGEHVSTLLSLTTAICRYYQRQRNAAQTSLNTPEQYGRYLVPFFMGLRDETVFALCLDAKGKVLCCKEVGRGSVNAAGVSIRKVVELALAFNATTVVLAHNHPSGVAVPSLDDRATTRRMAMALDAVGLELADHIVVADEDFVSMLQSHLYVPGECRALL